MREHKLQPRVTQNTCTPAQQLSPATEWNSTPAGASTWLTALRWLTHCRRMDCNSLLTRGSTLPYCQDAAVTLQRGLTDLTRVYWPDMTVPGARSAPLVPGSGHTSVCTAGCVCEHCELRKNQGEVVVGGGDREKGVKRGPMCVSWRYRRYTETCPLVYIGVIDYGRGNGSDSRHHVLESHQRNNCWALELYKPQKAWARETPASKH